MKAEGNYGQTDGKTNGRTERSTIRLLDAPTDLSGRRHKNGTQSAKMVSECTICIFFFPKILRESPGPPLSKDISITQPYCSIAAYIAPRFVYDLVPSGSEFSFSIHHWLCAFLGQFYKRYSLVWASLNLGLICTPDCIVLLLFFKLFSGEAPRTPTYRRGDTSRTLPHSALRASRNPPPPSWLLEPPLADQSKV